MRAREPGWAVLGSVELPKWQAPRGNTGLCRARGQRGRHGAQRLPHGSGSPRVPAAQGDPAPGARLGLGQLSQGCDGLGQLICSPQTLSLMCVKPGVFFRLGKSLACAP